MKHLKLSVECSDTRFGRYSRVESSRRLRKQWKIGMIFFGEFLELTQEIGHASRWLPIYRPSREKKVVVDGRDTGVDFIFSLILDILDLTNA